MNKHRRCTHTHNGTLPRANDKWTKKRKRIQVRTMRIFVLIETNQRAQITYIYEMMETAEVGMRANERNSYFFINKQQSEYFLSFICFPFSRSLFFSFGIFRLYWMPNKNEHILNCCCKTRNGMEGAVEMKKSRTLIRVQFGFYRQRMWDVVSINQLHLNTFY